MSLNNEEIDYSGIYVNGDDRINIFEKDDILYITSGKYVSGYIELDRKNKSASGDIVNHSYSIKYTDDGIDYETDDKFVPSGHYVKEKDITVEEYFESMFGKKEYFDKYNGLYKNDQGTIYIYQCDDDYYHVIIDHQNGFRRGYYEVMSNNSVSVTEGDSINIITLGDDTVTYTTVLIRSTKEKLFDGVYTRVGSLNMEEMITNKMMYTY